MVNRGPSAGCDTCRRRRIKCDEARPSCQNCLKRGIACLGYRSLFDRAHRDVTDDTRRRCQKKATDTYSTSSTSTSNGTSPHQSTDLSPYSAHSLPEINVDVLFAARSIPLGISQDYTQSARNWFIAVFAEHPSSTRANADFLLHLYPMVQKTAVNSPLHKALDAVAVSFAGVVTRDFANSDMAYSNYASATNLLRKSIADPQRSLDDDVLMTTLMLSFYDSVNGHFKRVHDCHESHLLGALALIDHRKSTNYKNEASKAMINHVQNNLLQHSLLCRKPLPATSVNWFSDPRMPKSPFRKLNGISRDLNDLLAGAEYSSGDLVDTLTITTVIQGLTDLDKRLVEWQAELPADCSPISMKTEEIPHAVRQAGVYLGSCHVYKNLQTAVMLNLWRTRRLMLLHGLQTCVALSSHCGGSPPLKGFERIHSTLQSLIDDICASIPFILGDVSRDKPSILAPEICFPCTTVDGMPFPESYSNHVRHATASGAWLLMEPLMIICNLTGECNGAPTLMLRDGQLGFITKQLKRLHQGIETCQCDSILKAKNGRHSMVPAPESRIDGLSSTA